MTEQTLDRPLKNDSPSDEISNSGASALTNDTPVTQDAARAPLAGAWGEASDGEDFDYVPVSPWAPIALCLGLLGLTGFIGIFGLYVAFFGIFIGIAAISRIRASAGFVKGTGIAAVGLVLSVASFALGSAKMAHAYSTEVPDGFKRVNFPKDIAEKGFVTVYGHRKLEPSVATLIGQKVYLKGFMWATQDTEGLTRFILLKDNGECCFGGKPKSHDYIFVTLASFNDGERPPLSYRAGGLSVKELNDEEKAKLKVPKDLQLTTLAYLGMVAAAGVLEADLKAGEKGPAEDFEYAPVYSMEAELVEEAWTRF
jgi:hypothetical protein